MEQRIDQVRMSESDRRIAKEHLHDAELVVELIYRAQAMRVREVKLLASAMASGFASIGRLIARHTWKMAKRRV